MVHGRSKTGGGERGTEQDRVPFDGAAMARGRIEEICLAPFQAQRLNVAGTEYRLAVAEDPEQELDEVLATLLDDMHRMADTHQCFLEASITCGDGRHWD